MEPKRIIIHHSATADSGTVSWGAIRHYHIKVRSWADVGYHAGCELVGQHEYECFYGRPVTQQGAHARWANHDSLGFCFVGNYDLGRPDPMMLAAAAHRVIAPWCKQFGIKVENILPHSDFSNKTCPGSLFSMDTLRRLVAVELEL